MNIDSSIGIEIEDARRYKADPDRPLYVDRRLRFAAIQWCACCGSAGRTGRSNLLVTSLCAPPGRLHARRPCRDRLGSCRAAGWRSPSRRVWRPNCAPGDYGTALGACRAPGKRQSRRRLARDPGTGGVLSARPGFGLINPDPLGREVKGPLPRFIDKNACPRAACRPPKLAAGMAGAAAFVSRRTKPPAGGRPTGSAPVPRWRLGPGSGRRVEALDLLPGGRAAAGPNGVLTSGWWAAPAKSPLAQEIVAAGGGQKSATSPAPICANGILAMAAASVAIFQRLRPDAYRSRNRHADDGHFRPHQPLSLAPLNGLAANGADQERTFPCQPCQRTVCTMNDHRCMARHFPPPTSPTSAQRVLHEAAPR